MTVIVTVRLLQCQPDGALHDQSESYAEIEQNVFNVVVDDYTSFRSVGKGNVAQCRF